MYELDETVYFFGLLIIPIMGFIFFALWLWKKRAQKNFSSSRLLKELSPNHSGFKPLLKLVVVMLALGFLFVALVNPKIGTRLETVKREGVDIVFAVDVSRSMLAEDIAPNRLEKAKRLVSEIINNLASDRIGIIAYAGQAFPQLPITTDYGSGKMFLQNLNTNMLSSQGTAIAEAIELAETYYNNLDQTNRVLFIISDGEDHASGVSDAVKDAVKQGIRIFTIGVGTQKGAPIPIKKRGIVTEYKKDRSGEVVITRLNEKTLKEIASEGDGDYINGTKTREVTDYIKKTLSAMDKAEFESRQFADFKDQFQWFLAAALLLLILDILFFDRQTAWIKRLNLFNENKKKR